MKTSEKGLQLIRDAEGLRLKAYHDSEGVLTIGYGHTGRMSPPKVFANSSITKAEAEEYLRGDAAEAEKIVLRNVRVPLSQNEFDALVSWVFNLGEGNLKRSTLLRKLNDGDYAGAAEQFSRWVYGGTKVLPGLVKRRAAERALFEQPGLSLPPVQAPQPEPKPAPAAQGFWASFIAAVQAWFQSFTGRK